MFYTFSQNNSGGSFAGPAHYVIIEADNAKEANSIAEEKGLYFDGVDDERDCECCGDRWYATSKNEGKKQPEIFGKAPDTYDDYVIYRKGESQ